MSGNIIRALKKIKSINDRITEGETKNQLELLAHILDKEIKNQFEKKKKDEAEDAELYPFSFDNRLCSIFP